MKTSAYIVIGWVLGASVLAGSALAQTPEELYETGNTAYREGRYQEAADAYRGILEYGVEDARVEYNLGNAAFKLGLAGQAILHYERAYRLDPTDPDVRFNLELVRSLLPDRVEPPEVAAPLRWIRGVQNGIGPDRQAIIAVALWWAVAAWFAWCTARPGRWRPTAGWIMSALLVMTLVVTSSWYVTARRLQTREVAVVLVEAVDVLAGPGSNNAPLVTVHEGLTLRIRSRRDQWIQVTLPDGLNGWVPEGAVGIV